MIRIITGSAKNKQLAIPNIPNFRGVQEVGKGSVFSIIGNAIKNSICLDLFAGSGNLGLEALSRGAAFCDFVDNNYEAKQAIIKNIKLCAFEDKSEFHFKDSVKFVVNTDKKYDYIFLDPFYDDTSQIFLFKNLEEIIAPAGLIIFFHKSELDLNTLIKNTLLNIVDERKFGKSVFTILKKA